MVVGIGLDIVETARVERALEGHGDRFETRVYTEDELRRCAGRADRVQALAARFAAKEACLKALGTGWSRGLGFRQVEVTTDEGGRPGIRLHDAASERAEKLGVASIHVSLSHQPGMAAAVVVLESERQDKGG